MAAASLAAIVTAQVAQFQKEFAEASRTLQKFEKDFSNTASSVTAQQKRVTDAFQSFSGDRLAREATAVAKAVEQIGGASKLTAAEQARVNAVVTEAIAKYSALGQQAPKALIDLEAATRKLATTTASASTQFSSLDKSVVSLGASGTKSSLAMDVLTGTFGKFTAAGVAVGIINKLGGALAEMAQRGTKIAPLQDAFERLATGVGESSEIMLDAMGTATRGLVQDFDLMQSANKALLLGLPTTTESMAKLAKTSTVLGQAMGLDATTALDNLIVALGRSSPLILDNLGLTVKVEEANKKYADALGITADALDDAQKKQAFMNEAMRKADERVAQIGEQSLTLSQHATTVVVTLSNMVTGLIGQINRAAGEMVTNVQNFFERIAKSAANFQNNFRNSSLAMEQFNQDFENTVVNAKELTPHVETLSDKFKKLTSDLSHLTTEQKGNIASGKSLGMNAKELAEAMNKLGGGIKLTEAHLNLYEDLTRKSAAATKESRDRSKELAKILADDVVKSYEATRIALKSYYDMILKANTGITDGVEGLNFRKNVELSAITKTVDVWQMYLALIKEVNSQVRLGVDSAPGQQFSGDALAGIWGKDEQATKAREIKKAEKFGQDLSRAIIGAIQGGGDIGKALGAQLGSSLGEEIGKKLAKGIGGTFGSVLGGMAGPLGAIAGGLLGGLVDKVFGGSKGRDMVKAFAESQGGFDALQKKIDKLGPGSEHLWKNLTQGVGRNNPQQAQAAIDAVTAALGRANAESVKMAPTFADVTAAAARYGIEVDKLGNSINQLRITELANQAVADWELLSKAGADLDAVVIGMADEMQNLVLESLKFGHTLPEAMRPILQRMVDMGLVTDEAGEKLTDLERLKFERPLVAAIDGLIGKMDQLIDKINVGLGGAIRGIPDIDMNVPQLGSGGIVRSPTLALIGESGPEAVVPLGSGGGFGSSAPIVVQTYLDGYQIAEATVPHIPAVVGRRA